MRDLVTGLEAAAGDDRVKGLVAHVGSGPLNMAYAQEIRDAVKAFRAKGKFAVAFAETFGEVGDGNTHYYLATAFDEIWLQPSGDVNLVGFSLEQPFMVDTLNFIGVTAQIDQREEYKGLADPFTKSSMPAPIRENLQRLVSSWLGQVAQGIAERGKFDADAARSLVDRGPFLASQAQAEKLIDKIGYWNDLAKAVNDRAGKEASWFPLEDYAANLAAPGDDAPRIALVYGIGAVQLSTGEGDGLFGPAAMESTAVAKAIRDAVDDTGVRAIIFRVDSPGGSYVASDTIWREVQRARDLGKPVIVSMGDVAASGGYFVSAPATKIVAQPGTITGSIGVAGGKVVFAGLWNTLRLNWDGVKAGANADIESVHRPFSNDGWARMQEGLDRVYADFTQKVAAGRKPADREGPGRRQGPGLDRQRRAGSRPRRRTRRLQRRDPPGAGGGENSAGASSQHRGVSAAGESAGEAVRAGDGQRADAACGSAAAGNPAAPRRLAGTCGGRDRAVRRPGRHSAAAHLAGAIDRQLRPAIRRSCGRRSGTRGCPRRR